MDFKGTRRKWEYIYNQYDNSFDVVSDDEFICTTMSGDEEEKANALLISKSPLLLKAIKDTIDDLKLLKSTILDASKTNDKLESVVEVIQNWIDRKEQLIKEATEL